MLTESERNSPPHPPYRSPALNVFATFSQEQAQEGISLYVTTLKTTNIKLILNYMQLGIHF